MRNPHRRHPELDSGSRGFATWDYYEREDGVNRVQHDGRGRQVSGGRRQESGVRSQEEYVFLD